MKILSQPIGEVASHIGHSLDLALNCVTNVFSPHDRLAARIEDITKNKILSSNGKMIMDGISELENVLNAEVLRGNKNILKSPELLTALSEIGKVFEVKDEITLQQRLIYRETERLDKIISESKRMLTQSYYEGLSDPTSSFETNEIFAKINSCSHDILKRLPGWDYESIQSIAQNIFENNCTESYGMNHLDKNHWNLISAKVSGNVNFNLFGSAGDLKACEILLHKVAKGDSLTPAGATRLNGLLHSLPYKYKYFENTFGSDFIKNVKESVTAYIKDPVSAYNLNESKDHLKVPYIAHDWRDDL